MEFEAVYAIKKEIPQEKFLRRVIIELGKDPDAPIDVVHASFGEVREGFREVLMCTAAVSGTVQASIGYDRQEPYTDYEKYREKIGDTYVERQRPVTKYRTVTDWRPFSTQFSGKATCVAFNDAKGAEAGSDEIRAIKTAKTENMVGGGSARLQPAALKTAISECETQVQKEQVSLPGDRFRDYRHHEESTVENVVCFQIPYYEVTYTYEGEKYTASGYACGTLVVDAEKPPKDMDLEQEVKDRTAATQAAANTAWWIAFGSLAVAALACFLLKFCWLWPVSVVALVLAVMANKKHNANVEECSKKLTSDIGAAKVEELKKALAAHGYEPLNEGESFHVKGDSIPKSVKPKSFTGKTVLCAILAVVMIIASFVVNDKTLHSPSQVEVKILSKTSEYDPDGGFYSRGCYNIHVEYEIKAKAVGVAYMSFKTLVDDKNGQQIGWMTTELRDLNLEAGKKTTVTVTYSEEDPEDNKFFSTFYEAELSDVKCKQEFETIRFTDGKNYSAN